MYPLSKDRIYICYRNLLKSSSLTTRPFVDGTVSRPSYDLSIASRMVYTSRLRTQLSVHDLSRRRGGPIHYLPGNHHEMQDSARGPWLHVTTPVPSDRLTGGSGSVPT